MTEMLSGTALVETLSASCRGRLLGPDDVDYETARQLYNAMIDKRPGLIARCLDVADVIAAVNAGREAGLDIAIRGGGHNGPGLGSCDGSRVGREQEQVEAVAHADTFRAATASVEPHGHGMRLPSRTSSSLSRRNARFSPGVSRSSSSVVPGRRRAAMRVATSTGKSANW